MHGGMKIYAGAPSAARHYVETGRGRADDYYLTEGTGIARRYSAGGGRVQELSPLAGDGYEVWVAGLDPDTAAARGRLRTDERAVRFVEVVINGPKSWSLAAALHPDVAAAYDAAQDRAATQVIGWLGEHATTRVEPRGGQVQVPVEVLEAVTMRATTLPAPAIPTGICTCRSTPECSPLGDGGDCTPSACGTSSRQSTGSDTPRSPPTRSSEPHWPATATP
jgi:hypothetical protein